jgi:hypothetical protein
MALFAEVMFSSQTPVIEPPAWHSHGEWSYTLHSSSISSGPGKHPKVDVGVLPEVSCDPRTCSYLLQLIPLQHPMWRIL